MSRRQAHQLRFVDVFAGIGGITLGLQRAGHTCVGQVEIDEYANRILERHWPNTPRIRDVKDFAGTEFGPFDLLAGGYPCQPFSSAGSRRGERDSKHLWPEVHRIIRAVRPRLVLLENVTGHLTLGFGRVLGDLAESGYDAEWDCIPAAAIGAPHQRDRVFIVAYPQGQGFPWGDIKHVRRNASTPHGQQLRLEPARDGSGDRTSDVANSDGEGCERQGLAITGREPIFAGTHVSQDRQWPLEPDVRRVVDGVPDWSHRIRTLGNAVVPQVAEWIGHRLSSATIQE